MKCCLCGREIKGAGNNPTGALDYYAKPIVWDELDRCCDVCYKENVISGRIFLSIIKKSV